MSCSFFEGKLWCGDLCRVCRWISAALWSSMGCSTAVHFTIIFSVVCRGFLLQHLGCLLGLLCWPSMFSINVLPLLSLMASAQRFTPFYKYIISERLLGSLMFSSLELGGTGCGDHEEVLSLFSQMPPLQSFCTKILPHQSVITEQCAVASIPLRGLDQDSILFTIMFWSFKYVTKKGVKLLLPNI